MTDEDESIRCSFCERTSAEVGPHEPGKPRMVTGLNGAICRDCVRKAARGELPVAHCSTCQVFDGKHQLMCPEGSGCA